MAKEGERHDEGGRKCTAREEENALRTTRKKKKKQRESETEGMQGGNSV